MKTLLIDRREVLYDDEDAECVEGANWWLSGSGLRYARTRVTVAPGKRQSVYMHRLIMQAPADTQVHHVNENTLDNRRVNLRIVTPIDNASAHYHSKQTGAHRLATGKWRARTRINGTQYSLGIFDDQATALRVSNAARDLLIGMDPKEAKMAARRFRYRGVMHGVGFDENISTF